MTAIVKRLHNSEAGELLEKFADKMQNKLVSDFIFIAREKDGTFTSHWFGDDSSLRCLGMVNYMAHKIASYIESE